MTIDGQCQCSACKAKPKRKREPGTPFGVNAHGEWRQQNSYFPQFAEQRWKRLLERRKRQRDLGDDE